MKIKQLKILRTSIKGILSNVKIVNHTSCVLSSRYLILLCSLQTSTVSHGVFLSSP